MVPSGRGQRKIGRCGGSKLKPSPNHGTLWLHNDDVHIIIIIIYMSVCYYFFALLLYCGIGSCANVSFCSRIQYYGDAFYVIFINLSHEQNASYTTNVNYCAVITSVVMAVELPEDIINQTYIRILTMRVTTYITLVGTYDHLLGRCAQLCQPPSETIGPNMTVFMSVA